MHAKHQINRIIKPLLIGLLLLNIIIVAMASYMLYSSKHRIEAEVSTYTQNLAHTLEGYIIGIIQKIDLSLLLTAHEVTESQYHDYNLASLLKSELQSNPDISTIKIVGPQGYIRYSLPANAIKPTINQSKYDYFISHKENSDTEMLIGKPVLNTLTQQWEVPFSHRINNSDGSFYGVVHATILLKQFDQIFSNIDVGEKGLIVLRNKDLSLIKRHPNFHPETSVMGSKVISTAMQESLNENSVHGTYKDGEASIDNINRIASYRQFKQYPFYITVGITEPDYLFDWYTQVKTTLLLVITFIVTSIILSFLLTRLLRQQESIQTELSTSEKLYRAERNLLHSVINNIPDLVWLKNLDGAYIICNQRFEQFFGAPAADIIGKTDYDFVEKSLADFFRLKDKTALEASGPTANEEKIIFPDGHSELLETTKSPVFDSKGNTIGILGIGHNITQRKRVELHDKFRSRLLEKITKTSSLTEILDMITFNIEQENEGMLCSILLLDVEGKFLTTGAAPSLPDFYNAAVNGIEIGLGVGSCGTAAYTGKLVIVEDIQTHPYWAAYKDLAQKASLRACWSQPIYSPQGKVLGTFAIYHRYTNAPSETDLELIVQTASLVSIAIEKIRAEEQIKLAATVFIHAGESITITDASGVIIDINDSFTRITGYSREEVLGKGTNILKSGKQPAEFYDELWKTLTEKGYWYGEIWNRRKNGETYAEMKTISAVHDTHGVITNYVALCTDITPLKEHQRQLERIAQYDVLTNLPNRSLLAARLSQAMMSCQRNKKALAVVFLDLDGFKKVNDIYGHDKGDELLINLSKLMHEALRDGDTLARFGGDEFVAIFSGLDKVRDCIPILERLLEAASNPITLDGAHLQVTASIGVTLYPQDEVDADQLLRHADQAMYIAKQSGKNRYHFFDTEQDNAIKIKRQSIEQVRAAMDNDEFVLYYQPKVNMRTGKTIGVEALIRWQHPERGLLSPIEFLPVIENHVMSLDLGQWVLQTALTQLGKWQNLEQELPESISVNISALQLQQNDFSDNIAALLDMHPNINPKNLELEVLETSAIDDVSHISSVMKECIALGVNFSLDDFGTGYSSLTYLRRLPANTIKIDQTFIRDMLKDTDDLAIVEGVIALAKSFKRDAIAEGVETIEHGSALLALGCELAQGYGIARPMPADDIPAWLEQWKPDEAWHH